MSARAAAGLAHAAIADAAAINKVKRARAESSRNDMKAENIHFQVNTHAAGRGMKQERPCAAQIVNKILQVRTLAAGRRIADNARDLRYKPVHASKAHLCPARCLGNCIRRKDHTFGRSGCGVSNAARQARSSGRYRVTGLRRPD